MRRRSSFSIIWRLASSCPTSRRKSWPAYKRHAARTIVGIVDASFVPDPARVRPGDAIVGLPAVGLHTNGYSLARALVPPEEWNAPFPAAGPGATYLDALLAEHPSYYQAVRAIQSVAEVKTMAHITGGGLLENVPRTLPENCKAIFEQSRWSIPPL